MTRSDRPTHDLTRLGNLVVSNEPPLVTLAVPLLEYLERNIGAGDVLLLPGAGPGGRVRYFVTAIQPVRDLDPMDAPSRAMIVAKFMGLPDERAIGVAPPAAPLLQRVCGMLKSMLGIAKEP